MARCAIPPLGAGEGARAVVFAHGLLFDHRMFDTQAERKHERQRELHMPFQVHMVVFGLLGVLFGVGELIAPAELMRVYGFQLDAGGVAIVRMAAALNLGFGLTAVLSYKTKDAVARRALLVAGVVYGVVGMAVTAHSTLTGAAGSMMWTNAFICVPLAVNAVRLLLAERGAATRISA